MTSETTPSGRPSRIRLGMVGGGRDAFIGAVHRIASRLDDHFTLVAGALSASAEKAQASGRELGLAPERTYDDFAAMAEAEATRPDGIEAVAIVTPNHMHYRAASAFLAHGIHVICDKPLTATLDEARKLVEAAEGADAIFILTHNYTGYPMVREAREIVARGDLGALRTVQVEYPQDWLAEPMETQGVKQAEWRMDPARSGAGGATGDIGTHAYNLLQFVTGLELDSLAADLSSFVPGRQLDDNAHVLLRFQGGAKGMLWASQVAVGNENALTLRVFGERGGLEWHQEQPNHLFMTRHGEPTQRLTRNGPGTGAAAARLSRVPPGHPEGYLEGFANVYGEAAEAIRAHRRGAPPPDEVIFPTVRDGLAGVAFVDACVRSSQADAAWVRLE